MNNLAQRLREYRLDHLPVHIRQSAIQTVVVIRQFGVIQTKQMQGRGVKIPNRGHVLFRAAPEGVGGAVTHAGFHTGSHHPAGEAVGVVVAPAEAPRTDHMEVL